MKRNILLKMMALAVASMLLIPAIGNAKTVSSLACKAWQASQTADFDYSWLHIKNMHPTNNRWVMCDLIRDNSQNTTQDVSIFLRLDDASTTSAVECDVYSCNHLGTECEMYHISTGNSDVGHKSIPVNVTTSYFNGYYAAACELPPNSSVNSLYINEPL